MEPSYYSSSNQSAPRTEPPRGLNQHILTNSATMVGVCITAISVIRIVHMAQPTMADEFIAFDSLVFTSACLLSYASLRNPGWRSARYEHMADVLFLIGLVGLSLVSFGLALRLF